MLSQSITMKHNTRSQKSTDTVAIILNIKFIITFLSHMNYINSNKTTDMINNTNAAQNFITLSGNCETASITNKNKSIRQTHVLLKSS